MSGFPQFPPLSLVNNNPALVPLSIGGAAGQSNDLLDIYVGPGLVNKVVSVDPAGHLVIGVFAAFDGTNNSVIGETTGTGQFLLDAAVNDTCLRASTGKTLRFGAGATNSTVQIGATSIGFGNLTLGLGNGASTNLTALAKSTGSGPASDVVNQWVAITINGTAGWFPFFV